MKKLIILVVTLVIIAGGWWLGSPLFIDNVVNEQFPNTVTAELFPTEAEIEEMSETEKIHWRKKMDELATTMPDKEVQDLMPGPKDTPVQREVKQELAPLLLSKGSFVDGDDFHKGSGEAKIFQIEAGEKLLRLEDFAVTNGPALYVYLVEKANPQTSADVKAGFYNLEKLKGNKGNQNYVIPKDVDLEKYQSVVIYCQPFSTIFATATLSAN